MKGRAGCFLCGAPSTHKVLVWLRESVEGTKDKSGSRLQRTVASIMRSYCADCADEIMGLVSGAVRRTWPACRGCALCGARSALRVQVWLTTVNHKSIRSASASLCQSCSHGVYSAACEPLDPERYRRSPKNGDGLGLGLAEARRRLHAEEPAA